SPRSRTSAPWGCLTEAPASTMRSPCMRISPGRISFPALMSSSRAACSTTARGGTGAGWLSAIVGASREQESAKTMVRVSITPAMVSLAGEPIPDWDSPFCDRDHESLCNVSRHICGESGRLNPGGYERIWGPDESKTGADCSDPFDRVFGDCGPWFRGTEAWDPAGNRQHRGLCADRDLPGRGWHP